MAEPDGCTVDVHVGLTFQMGPLSSNQYGRLDITLRDIRAATADVDSEEATKLVDAQVRGGIAATRRAFAYALLEIDQQVKTIVTPRDGTGSGGQGKK